MLILLIFFVGFAFMFVLIGSYIAGVPNLGCMYPQGYICLSESVHLRLAIDEKMYLHIIYFQIFLHISVIIILINNTLIVKYIYEKS